MLHGAFTPPYCPALPAHRLGSISLCGGARSNCAHPQNMSRGKNIRSPASASFEVFAGGVLCVLPETETKTTNVRIHDNVFIPPPGKLVLQESGLTAPRSFAARLAVMPQIARRGSGTL